jgi:hypothetical protein
MNLARFPLGEVEHYMSLIIIVESSITISSLIHLGLRSFEPCYNASTSIYFFVTRPVVPEIALKTQRVMSRHQECKGMFFLPTVI